MAELLTSQQMRSAEQAEIALGQTSGQDLMERAGAGVVQAILEKWPEVEECAKAGAHPTVCVLCGPGNNGGDGFVVAHKLDALGWRVNVYLLGDPARLPEDARWHHDKWAASHPVSVLDAKTVCAGPRPDFIIDAVFGIGLKRPLADDLAQTLDAPRVAKWKSAFAIKKVAVDCPSGLDLDTGMIAMPPMDDEDISPPSRVNSADLTVTFHAPKVGHYLGIGPTLCGDLKVVDIGLGAVAMERGMLGMLPEPDQVRLINPFHLNRPLPKGYWPRSLVGKSRGGDHKFGHGHVMVFAGGVGKGGAARLAARAALRSGAGLVTVLCPPAALIENACQLEAVMLRALRKDQALSDVADARVTGFVVGPGMGVSDRTRGLVKEVLARRAEDGAWRDPVVVLDACALSSFSDDPQALFALTHARTIMTPHEGEFARLFPDLSGPARRSMSKVDAARIAAARSGSIILLKGPDTVIASPSGGCSVHAASYGRDAPWLATAGAGDVLAGLIAGLAAPSTSGDLFAAAELAAYLHVEAARSFGPGLIAEDLPDVLPKVLRDIGF